MLLRLPLPEWLPSVPPAGLAMDFKWLLRRLCLALGVTATVCAAITFRNVEKENLRWAHSSSARLHKGHGKKLQDRQFSQRSLRRIYQHQRLCFWRDLRAVKLCQRLTLVTSM